MTEARQAGGIEPAGGPANAVVPPLCGRRPRLLFLINEFFFFYTHRLPVARAARDAGYEVHVAAPNTPGWAPADFDVAVLRDEGFELHEFPLQRRGVNPLEELQTFLGIWLLYRRLRPDLVHHLTIKPVLYGSLAAKLCQVPAVINAITGLGQVFVAEGQRAKFLRGLVRLVYRVALQHRNTRVIVQNPEDGDQLLEIGAVNPATLVLIRGSGVDLDEFSAVSETEGTPVIILPARLIWEKGVGEFVAAARLLKAQQIQAKFVLIGGTIAENPRAVPEAQLKEWTTEGVVDWLGYRSDMPAILSNCHIVCLPSRYGEGVPKVLIEAAASGRPAVASNIPGCREIIRNEINGLLVEPGDVAGLAQALAALIADSGKRRRFGEVGREIASAEFSQASVVARTLEIYRMLSKGGRR